ncbi:macrophage mannose receptor 1-like isoform X1 [Colossoma macropomum]|uniref:macrophage mannose receptor 1-like isoform X1 n=1 Tax=Colossoma macropomum TaxID=42526 RepID=UPI0018646BE9|nr:macrophage mannose receptor 1-like isoform X1 [Colossoma macropomum]
MNINVRRRAKETHHKGEKQTFTFLPRCLEEKQRKSFSEMDQTWISIILLLSAVCGVSAYVPHQYIFVNENKTWTEAQSYCRQNYADLATINNMEEMKKLNSTLNKLKDALNISVWIGLVRGDAGKWLWSLADGNFHRDGDTYRNWRSGEPDNGVNRDEYCVAMLKDNGTWFDVQCKKLYTFVCYNEKKMSTERYIFINETTIWHDAQSYCREHHTDLVSVRNQTENQQIHNMLKMNTNVDRIWIGLFNDSWKWSDQSDSSFRYWMSGPENYGQGQKCAAVLLTEKGQWNNEKCDNQLPFICYENQLILINQNLTWREALRYCRDHHVDLVSVLSEEIQLWVNKVAQKASTEHVWLGLRHTCTQGFWYWVSGFSICYENWAPGNGTGGEDCSSVERTGAVQSRGGQQWVSLPEDHKLNFICITYED